MGGSEPAPSNVMTVPDWRGEGWVGAARVRGSVARRAAAVVVGIFIVD